MQDRPLKTQALESILGNYREALRLVYGDEVADKSILQYDTAGWYHCNVPEISTLRIGSTLWGLIAPHREATIVQLTENLLKRAKEKGIEYQPFGE